MDFVKTIGFNGKIISMTEIRNIKLRGKIKVFGCVNGVTLLKEFSRYILELRSNGETIEEPVYLTRGNARRTCINEEEIEEVMKRAGIKTKELSKMPIISQLLYCCQSKGVVSQHGAQLINALTVRGKILEN